MMERGHTSVVQRLSLIEMPVAVKSLTLKHAIIITTQVRTTIFSVATYAFQMELSTLTRIISSNVRKQRKKTHQVNISF
jgi:hypothetical protein